MVLHNFEKSTVPPKCPYHPVIRCISLRTVLRGKIALEHHACPQAVVAVLLVALAVAHAGIIAGPVATQYTALVAPGISYAAHVPAVAYAAPAVVAAAPVAAGYTAVTRGAVHSAPLPGHVIGSTHVNVQPAPGTI
ncbi:Putative cuticle protein [Gryllus bimaculatus]|nr:Putative cuticle protein [Gryllus bimaculatus]